MPGWRCCDRNGGWCHDCLFYPFLKRRIAGWERAVYHFAEWLKGEVKAGEKAQFHAKAGAKADSFLIREQKDEIRYRFQDGPPGTQRALELRRLPLRLPAGALDGFDCVSTQGSPARR